MYQQYQEGWIEVICGCMFAGKSEELIRRIHVLSYAKKKIQVFKPMKAVGSWWPVWIWTFVASRLE